MTVTGEQLHGQSYVYISILLHNKIQKK